MFHHRCIHASQDILLYIRVNMVGRVVWRNHCNADIAVVSRKKRKARVHRKNLEETDSQDIQGEPRCRDNRNKGTGDNDACTDSVGN